MEQKTNPSGQQAAPDKGTQREPSAWLQEVVKVAGGITEALDEAKDPARGIITIAVDNDDAAVILAGGSYPLARAVKEVMTGSKFAQHVANACRLMAAEATENGEGTVIIHVKPEPTTGTAGQEAKTDED